MHVLTTRVPMCNCSRGAGRPAEGTTVLKYLQACQSPLSGLSGIHTSNLEQHPTSSAPLDSQQHFRSDLPKSLTPIQSMHLLHITDQSLADITDIQQFGWVQWQKYTFFCPINKRRKCLVTPSLTDCIKAKFVSHVTGPREKHHEFLAYKHFHRWNKDMI